MSSVSYANVAAGVSATTSPLNGASAPSTDSVPQDLKVESLSTRTEDVDDSSATTEEDVKEQQELDVSTDSVATTATTTTKSLKSNKKEKSKVKLAPAPVPKISPWVKKTSTSPKSSNVNDKHWPTPEVSVLDETNASNKSKTVIPSVKSTGKEKWVPFQASVVMSGPKGTKNNNQNNSGNQKKLNKGKKNSNKDQQSKQNGSNRRNQRQTASKNDQNDKNHIEDDSNSLNSIEKESIEDSNEINSSPNKLKSDSNEIKNHQNQSHSRQYSNGNVRRFQNRPHNGYVPFNRNVNFIPTTYLPSGQVFQPRGYNQNFIPQHANIPQQQQSPQQQHQPQIPQQHSQDFRRFSNGFPPQMPPTNFNNPYPNVLPILQINPAVQQINQLNAQDPITSLAIQVDYYFSIQNLLKDQFLRRQMDDNGYIPLKVISNFHRVQFLSGGDLKLLIDSLELCNNLEFIGNKETFDIKIRAKENPLNWVLPKDQRDL